MPKNINGIIKLTPEKVLLWLSALTCISITPFAIIRFYQHDIALAIMDACIALAMFFLFIYLYLSKNIEVAKGHFALFIFIAFISSIVIKGQSQVLWAFPTIISIYYLLPLKTARNVIALMIALLLYILYPETGLIYFLTNAITTGLTSTLAYIIFKSYTEQHDKLQSLASIDPLTASGNRRALDLKLSEIILSQQREAYDMCLILFDLDYFKKINDDHGHAVGDKILITLCNLIKKNTRVLDSLYRYGGDEFIIIPLNMNIKTTQILAEKIRSAIELYEFPLNIQVTVSVGTAQFKMNDTPESWISRADKLLYKVKSSGRNKVLS